MNTRPFLLQSPWQHSRNDSLNDHRQDSNHAACSYSVTEGLAMGFLLTRKHT